MDYEKAMKILGKDNQQGFQYFLTLNTEQLGELIQFLSDQDETKIFNYLRARNHVPVKLNCDTKPPFVDSIKALYKKLYFPEETPAKEREREREKEREKQKTPQEKQEQESEWFKHLFQRENEKERTKETKFNFPYFNVVRKLMTAHESEPDEQAVKVMHSELEILMKRVFCSRFVDGIKRMLGVNKDMFLIPREETQKTLTASHVKTYLSKLFDKEYTNFRAFKDEYEQIKKDVEVEPSESEASPGEEKGDNVKQLYEVADTNEETEYYLSKTRAMGSEELCQFYRAREANFIKEGSQKLISFTRLGSVLTQPKNKEMLEVLSYILCMTVRRIIFTKIREVNEGKLISEGKLCSLPHRMSAEEIQRIGNEYIEQVEKKAKTYSLKYEMFMKKAFDLFKEEFASEGYDAAFQTDTKIKLIKSEEEVVSKSDDQKVGEVWKKNKQFRKRWYERVVAQQQIKQQENDKDFKPVNDYSAYIHQNRALLKSMGFSRLFKRFLFGISQEPEFKDSKPKRLSSLFE